MNAGVNVRVRVNVERQPALEALARAGVAGARACMIRGPISLVYRHEFGTFRGAALPSNSNELISKLVLFAFG